MKELKVNRIVMLIGCVLLIAGVGAAEEPVDRSLPEHTGIPAPDLAPWTGLEGGSLGPVGVIDDFNRADGGLGSDWTVQSPSVTIVNNAATGTSGGLATHISATGDTIEIDVIAHPSSTNTQYAAAVLNYGGGSSNLFIKVQNNGGTTDFTDAACYTGNNGGSFGLGFFGLSEPFSSARMVVTVDGARSVTIDFVNVNGGALADQQYVCTGAPPAEGPGLGIGTYGNNEVMIDNFGDGPIPVELMTFSVE